MIGCNIWSSRHERNVTPQTERGSTDSPRVASVIEAGEFIY